MAILYEGIPVTDPKYKASMMVCPCGESALYMAPGKLTHAFDSALMDASMHNAVHRKTVYEGGELKAVEVTTVVYNFGMGTPFPDHLVTPKTRFLTITTFGN